MKSVNKVFLLGNVGQDPKLNDGKTVARVSLATNERSKDQNGDWQDKTEWHNVVLFGRLAEIAGEYVKKGSKVHVEGRLQTRRYEQDGVTKYSTEVVASDLVLLGEGGGGGNNSTSNNRTTSSSAPTNRTASKPAPRPQQPIADDDIPF